MYRLFTILCIVFGWVLFRANGLRQGLSYLLSMLGIGSNELASAVDIYNIKNYVVILAVCTLFSFPIIRIIKNWCEKSNRRQIAYSSAEAMLLIVIAIASVSSCAITAYDPFIYFNF